MISCPRLTIAGLGGDSGKTVLSVGLSRFWQTHGFKVVPFKKGPDYIDMEWLSRAARQPCYNLDLFLMSRDDLLSSVDLHARNNDLALIEGNRGLYDGMNEQGTVSTAELAKMVSSPVILIVDCTKVTRTVAALVLGCRTFDRDVPIQGIVLNNLAGKRHESIIRKSLELSVAIPVIGAIPRLKNIPFPGRHLGLVPPQEHPMSEEAISQAEAVVSRYVDTDEAFRIAQTAVTLEIRVPEYPEMPEAKVNIGVIRDSAFQFYYQENIDSLKRAGAYIYEFSALTDDLPQELDALYIGGGFPETHAEAISENRMLRTQINEAAERGLPVYAECGGLMYLAEELIWKKRTYPMTGVLPLSIGISTKTKGHGYTMLEVETDNIFYKKGLIIRGHEFHYSYVKKYSGNKDCFFAFSVKKGHGIVDQKDGLCYKNILATYSHVHALGTKEWERGIIAAAVAYKTARKGKQRSLQRG